MAQWHCGEIADGILAEVWPEAADLPAPLSAPLPQHKRDAARARDHARIAAVKTAALDDGIAWNGYSTDTETVVLDAKTKGKFLKRRGREIRRGLRGLETIDSAWRRRELECLRAFFEQEAITGVFHGGFRLHADPAPVEQLRAREQEFADAFGNDLRRAAQRNKVEIIVRTFECPPVPGTAGAFVLDHVHFERRGPWASVQKLQEYMQERYVDAWIGKRPRSPASLSNYLLKGPLSKKDPETGHIKSLVDEFSPKNLLVFWEQIKGLKLLQPYGAYRKFRRTYKATEDDDDDDDVPPRPARRWPGAPRRTGIRMLRTGYDHLPIGEQVEFRRVLFVSVPSDLLDRMSGEEIFLAITQSYDLSSVEEWANNGAG